MYSESTKLLRFLGRPQRFELPVYQRPYTWKAKTHCRRLFDDLYYIGNETKRDTWYLGAIVYQNTGGNLARPVLTLIDGQQRITTVTLIICAITEYLRKHPKTKLEDVKNWDSLLKECVIYSEGEEDNWYRLLLNNEDDADLRELIYKISIGEDIPKYKGSSNIYSNFQFFRRNINKNNIGIIYDGLRKLEMVHISLDEKDVAQNIFETLNATGESLMQIDQIRNYLLMGMKSNVANEIYAHYWKPMEQRFTDSNLKNAEKHFDWFSRYYLITKLGRNVRTNDVYGKFKIVSDNFENAKKCIMELNEFSEYYLNLFGNCEKDKVLNKEFSELHILKMRLMSPFLMKLYQQYRKNIISKEEFLDMFHILKSHYLRRALCGWAGNNGLDAVALKLCKIIEDGGRDEFIECLFTFKGNDRFLSDSQVRTNIPMLNFKRFPKNHFVLSKLINFNKSAPIDTSELDVVYLCREVSDEYIDKLGNCTLEGIDLCMDIEAETNEEFIDKRTDKLTELILRVWEYPTL